MAEKTKEEAPAEELSPKVNRREFLNYVWGASMALFMAEIGVVGYLFAYPRFREGEFGGAFILDVTQVPPEGTPPVDNPEGKFWLAHTDDGVKALYKVCTHLGCLYKWVSAESRFECPCHGSKFEPDGTYIEGPAPRDLDQFEMTALDADGNELAKSESASPLSLPPDTAQIRVDTGKKVQGRPI